MECEWWGHCWFKGSTGKKRSVTRDINNNNKLIVMMIIIIIIVEPEMYDYTSYNWSHLNSNEKLKEKSVSYTREIFDRFTSADSCTGNSTHNTESTAVGN
jgi:7-keto-8-aminopelargonate synthetase-like enzyme